jgi:hypothetical protein
VLSVAERIWHQVLLEFEPNAKLSSSITVPQDDGSSFILVGQNQLFVNSCG